MPLPAKNWKQRWFTLVAPTIFNDAEIKPVQLIYYRDAKASTRLGIIEPRYAIAIREADALAPHNGFKYGFELEMPGRTYLLQSSTASEREEWIHMLQDCIEVGGKQRLIINPTFPCHPSTGGGADHLKLNLDLGLDLGPTLLADRPTSIVSSNDEDDTKVKSWKRRYFHLRGEYIVYYRAKGISPPLGQIDLNECVSVGERDDPTLQFAFEICTPERTFLLQAEAQEDRHMWLQAIRAVLSTREASRIEEGFDSDPAPEEHDPLPL
ncbi:uncharacterized protein MONBRDRAFT_5148 [Monosiga brevicollis MX1]|uniref:PH domain-containing protein n=1 Tax=Monosiga brevicollis TaxID=81824 RepID=A9UQ24_MONBE|nr:uncharacterized protein MONBRDRAFT_5148 [Monosiga brevicollis MX1]EDQ92522.1 predicted protein [Monosiga brevicollis MX1]|eukprot:XP_001742284.1 hypothetical protein [Monosiga brevicollis MX1]